MKNRVTEVIAMCLELMEVELERFDKHVVRTATLEDRAMNHLVFECGNDDTEYCTTIGFKQAMQSVLYGHGYRSVRKGLFVNLERCESIQYLQAMEENSDIDIETRARVRARISELKRNKMDGQSKMQFNGSEFAGIVEMPNEDDFMEMLEADAV